MTGVILCGGQSSRMGQDKGTLITNGITWAQLAASKLAALSLPYVCSVGEMGQNAYHELFAPHLIIGDNPSIHVSGPLKGILSVHQQLPCEHLFVLAVDMPLMPEAILKTLMLAALEHSHEAYVFQNSMQLEPLCAIYTIAALRRINEMAASGTLARFSMHYILSLLQTKVVTADAPDAHYFLNCNTPEDLGKL